MPQARADFAQQGPGPEFFLGAGAGVPLERLLQEQVTLFGGSLQAADARGTGHGGEFTAQTHQVQTALPGLGVISQDLLNSRSGDPGLGLTGVQPQQAIQVLESALKLMVALADGCS